MNTVNMETVGGYFPLAGTGRNTIRKMSKKYASLRPGDQVVMEYGSRGVVEFLEVASVAAGPRFNIINSHWHRNHARFDDYGACVSSIAALYPDTDGGTPFCAIYFK